MVRFIEFVGEFLQLGLVAVWIVFGWVGCSGCSTKKDVAPKGSRVLSIALTPANGDIDLEPAFDVAVQAGMDEPGDINLDWRDIEPEPENYVDPAGLLAWSNDFYASRVSAILVTITPIQTSYLAVPDDLDEKPFDDPEVIHRFEKMLEFVFSSLPDLNIRALSIGNEVELFFGDDDLAGVLRMAARSLTSKGRGVTRRL